MAPNLPRSVDTVIVGNGPSALILSYILHGHIPFYTGPHPDPLLHEKLSKRRNLLDLTPDLYSHFQASLTYSTQALPVNVLLDTLIRPNADTEVGTKSCVEWRHVPEKAVSHIILGSNSRAGGQWADNCGQATADIGALSYSELLSLPSYSFAKHYRLKTAHDLPAFYRPSRSLVADYYAAFPSATGISHVLYTGAPVAQVSRTSEGFHVGSHNISCRHLVLASGVFDVSIIPPPLLQPLTVLSDTTQPLLVVGSGFSAADIILSTSPWRKIIHIFRWSPEDSPSPLRGCHRQAYPEYATVYRQMKTAAADEGARPAVSPMARRDKRNHFFSERDWASVYRGLPNAEVIHVMERPDRCANVSIRLESGTVTEVAVGEMEYVVGRRGSLDYLNDSLRNEVLGSCARTSFDKPHAALISGKTLRSKAEVDLEVSNSVFITGSLTGDSLVRHAFGSCAYVAGKIIKGPHNSVECNGTTGISVSENDSLCPCKQTKEAKLAPAAAAHPDLHLDKKRISQAMRVTDAENRLWRGSGCWGGPIS